VSIALLFEAVKEAFFSVVADNFYCYTYPDGYTEPGVVKKCRNPTILDNDDVYSGLFETGKYYKTLVEDGLFYGSLGTGNGIIIYPKKNNLYTVADTIHSLQDILYSGRTEREKVKAEITSNRELGKEEWLLDTMGLFVGVQFLSKISESLGAELVHILYERNPAADATSIHFFQHGSLVDDYFCARIGGECEIIEVPENADVIKAILDGRFSFLLDQPRTVHYKSDDFDETWLTCFEGEDIANIDNLHVPFWENEKSPPRQIPEEDMLQPYGAIYFSSV
jgi:hypothetical protein